MNETIVSMQGICKSFPGVKVLDNIHFELRSGEVMALLGENGAGNAVKASGSDVVCVGFDKSDAILGLIDDGYILATMAQNPDVMGAEGVKAAVAALKGENLGGAVTDTGVSVLTK